MNKGVETRRRKLIEHKNRTRYMNLVGLLDLEGDLYIAYYYPDYEFCWGGCWINKYGESICKYDDTIKRKELPGPGKRLNEFFGS
jgi:hypothetical protein